MDNELKHILCGIDSYFDNVIGYMYDLDYNDELIIVKDEYIFNLNELITYTRALEHKLNESYKAILESRDNGDMI